MCQIQEALISEEQLFVPSLFGIYIIFTPYYYYNTISKKEWVVSFPLVYCLLTYKISLINFVDIPSVLSTLKIFFFLSLATSMLYGW